jgi:hypothetical protein
LMFDFGEGLDVGRTVEDLGEKVEGVS